MEKMIKDFIIQFFSQSVTHFNDIFLRFHNFFMQAYILKNIKINHFKFYPLKYIYGPKHNFKFFIFIDLKKYFIPTNSHATNQ